MPSVDILSKVDLQMLDNAVNVVKRELESRYDLRGTNSKVEADQKALTIKISTEDHMKLDSILDLLLERSGKQKVDVFRRNRCQAEKCFIGSSRSSKG